ncbi:hypothetical protein J6590_012434 [Homalodisca vitripennis]|nr:hypothetical protein J6590_012434 [Homalodisca vitripennis]
MATTRVDRGFYGSTAFIISAICECRGSESNLRSPSAGGGEFIVTEGKFKAVERPSLAA